LAAIQRQHINLWELDETWGVQSLGTHEKSKAFLNDTDIFIALIRGNVNSTISFTTLLNCPSPFSDCIQQLS